MLSVYTPEKGLRKCHLLFLLPLAVIILFFFLPVFSILRFINIKSLSLIVGSPYYFSVIGFTITQAIISTFFSVLLGLPGAWIMSHVSFRGKNFFYSLTTVPFVLPSIIVVTGFVLFLGNNGIINNLLSNFTGLSTTPLRILYTFKAIILAHTFYNFPISLRLISTEWQKIGKNRLEAAEILGAGKIKIFFTIILPAILPSIIASASLIFIFCFMSFAIVLVLGGGPEYTTIEVEIYRLARVNIDLELASSLALIGAILTSFFTFFYVTFQKKLSSYSTPETPISEKKIGNLSLKKRIFVIIYLLLILLFLMGPIVTIIIRSFQTRTGWNGEIFFSCKNYLNILKSSIVINSIKNSLKFALFSLSISILSGLLASFFITKMRGYSSVVAETIFMFPMGLSSIVLGLGYYSVLSSLSFNNLSGIFIIMAHTMISLPFIIRTLTTGIKTIPPNLSEASHSLGANTLKTFLKIELPLLKGSIITAISFAFCISIGDINTTMILSDTHTTTIPIIIYRYISSYNFFGACAMGTILIILCGSAFYLIDKFGGKKIF